MLFVFFSKGMLNTFVLLKSGFLMLSVSTYAVCYQVLHQDWNSHNENFVHIIHWISNEAVMTVLAVIAIPKDTSQQRCSIHSNLTQSPLGHICFLDYDKSQGYSLRWAHICQCNVTTQENMQYKWSKQMCVNSLSKHVQKQNKTHSWK